MNTIYKNFKITAVLKGEKETDFFGRVAYCNEFFVTLVNMETKQKTGFSFFDSIYNYENGKEELNKDDLLNAFYCFLSDADAGSYSFDDFCSCFGYDNDSIKALKTWKQCKKSAEKWERIAGMNENERYNFFNELQEIAG